jgi:hypothetical protein
MLAPKDISKEFSAWNRQHKVVEESRLKIKT